MLAWLGKYSRPGGYTVVSSLTEAIREQLMASSEEYQRLCQEHARYAAQLARLAAKPYLTEQEQMEEVRLKKLKLRVKDQMEILVHQARVA
jgi:uncharacterized protein YdcH (DUF465 family)